VKGEFVGGCDIVREMFQADELAPLLTAKGIAVAPTPTPAPAA
jgi:monothiol glutaredoxin